MIDLTPIIQALIVLLAAVITTFLVPLLKRKVDREKLDNLYAWVTIAVEAAEQLYSGASGMGKEKKEYVLTFLHDKGFTVDIELLEAMLESAVLNLKV